MHLEQVYIPTRLSVMPRSPLEGSTMTENVLVGRGSPCSRISGSLANASLWRAVNVLKVYCSLIDSSSETADQSVTLAKEGMLGS